MYGQPARALRRRANMEQEARAVASYYGDGEALLCRAAAYLEKEFVRAGRDAVRRAGIKGALSVLNAARHRVLTEVEEIPF